MAPCRFLARPTCGLAIADRQEPTVYSVRLSRSCCPLPAPLVTNGANVAPSRCGEWLSDASLSKKGDPSGNRIWVARLTHDRKERGTKACRGSGNRPESVRTESRETRVAGSRLDCLKSV